MIPVGCFFNPITLEGESHAYQLNDYKFPDIRLPNVFDSQSSFLNCIFENLHGAFLRVKVSGSKHLDAI